MINVDGSIELEQKSLSGKYFEQELIGCLVKVIEILRREVGLKKNTLQEVLGHLNL